MRIVYGVPWIEIEFGRRGRTKGYKLFNSLEECILDTKKDSLSGHYEGGYIGPVRPLSYVEIPLEVLEETSREYLETNSVAFSSNNWEPRFKSNPTWL